MGDLAEVGYFLSLIDKHRGAPLEFFYKVISIFNIIIEIHLKLKRLKSDPIISKYTHF